MRRKILATLIASLLLGVCSLPTWAQDYKYPFQNPQLDDEVRIENLVSLLSLDEKINLFGGAGIPRLGVRGAGSSEAIHGVVQGGPAWNPRNPQQVTTTFPQGYGLGETWDRELIQQVAAHIGYEGRYLFQSPK